MTDFELPRIQEEEEEEEELHDELDIELYCVGYCKSPGNPVIAKRGGTPPPPWGYRPPKPPTEFESFIRAREKAFASLKLRIQEEREKQYIEFIKQLPDIDTPPLYHRPMAEERRRDGRLVYPWIAIICLIAIPFLATMASCVSFAVPLVMVENSWNTGNRRIGEWQTRLLIWIKSAVSMVRSGISILGSL
ncbi:hypothetical protein V1525DRAFT_386168 [Lipomyces kononenkoae]|uniref:Uncharacterized protein n=1 Tax=Lipomyces kononenkoae TaxID=34357 RepID=A0ACC3T7N5_LIPKO